MISLSNRSIAFNCGATDMSRYCIRWKFVVEPPPLFSNLTADCKLIATKSRHFNTLDKQFIKQELKKLLDKNILNPANLH